MERKLYILGFIGLPEWNNDPMLKCVDSFWWRTSEYLGYLSKFEMADTHFSVRLSLPGWLRKDCWDTLNSWKNCLVKICKYHFVYLGSWKFPFVKLLSKDCFLRKQLKLYKKTLEKKPLCQIFVFVLWSPMTIFDQFFWNFLWSILFSLLYWAFWQIEIV
jgi:hypothetical protein